MQDLNKSEINLKEIRSKLDLIPGIPLKMSNIRSTYNKPINCAYLKPVKTQYCFVPFPKQPSVFKRPIHSAVQRSPNSITI